MKVTLAQLTVFATLCETLHFTRAAERVGLTQPTVSKEMRTLERALGLQLLARSAGGTRLTPAGQALEPHARTVLEQVDELMAAAAPGASTRAAPGHDGRVTHSVVNRACCPSCYAESMTTK